MPEHLCSPGVRWKALTMEETKHTYYRYHGGIPAPGVLIIKFYLSGDESRGETAKPLLQRSQGGADASKWTIHNDRPSVVSTPARRSRPGAWLSPVVTLVLRGGKKDIRGK
ncbi:Hypothetical protein NGAL_HAMBI2610_40890 [Neorhizobium galegae bv. orientalis]|nr:Hypothetical protein NGAL_HAMBI2610_40890 [Neorhizobium galegae bv. orientalis]